MDRELTHPHSQSGVRDGFLYRPGEDLQWADAETIDVLEYLADNIAGAPILNLVSIRSDEPSAALSRVIHAPTLPAFASRTP